MIEWCAKRDEESGRLCQRDAGHWGLHRVLLPGGLTVHWRGGPRTWWGQLRFVGATKVPRR